MYICIYIYIYNINNILLSLLFYKNFVSIIRVPENVKQKSIKIKLIKITKELRL